MATSKAISKKLLQVSSGFPDMGVADAIALDWMSDIIRTHYKRAGYPPIETALVERPEILTAKASGEIRSQMYGIRYMNPVTGAEDDTKHLGLRFDQTVPFARFVAANYGSLAFPFRRHVIGPVFRGERPKDGRYRQFTQADIDVVGNETLSLLHDAEMVSVITGIFQELHIGSFTIRIGNRKILQGLLESIAITGKEKIQAACTIIDKLERDGHQSVTEQLVAFGLKEADAETLLTTLRVPEGVSTDERLSMLHAMELDSALFHTGVQELEEVVGAVRDLRVPEECFLIDVSIARALDYYTGTVYETRLNDHPNLGSIASGGRYDDLVSNFIDRKVPGVGISIGVTRLLLRLIKARLISANITTVAPVLVTAVEPLTEYRRTYLQYASTLRAAGISVESFLEQRPLGKQLQFASKRGFRVAIISGVREIQSGTVMVRDLKRGEQTEVSVEALVETVQQILATS